MLLTILSYVLVAVLAFVAGWFVRRNNQNNEKLNAFSDKAEATFDNLKDKLQK